MGKLKGAMYLKSGLANGDDFYNVGVIITVSGSSLSEISEKKRIIRDLSVSMDIRLQDFEYQAEQVFQAVLTGP